MSHYGSSAVTECGNAVTRSNRWTRNQRRAARLAVSLSRGRTGPTLLSDEDWALLLLASGANNMSLAPTQVSERVLQSFVLREGYFAALDSDGCRQAVATN